MIDYHNCYHITPGCGVYGTRSESDLFWDELAPVESRAGRGGCATCYRHQGSMYEKSFQSLMCTFTLEQKSSTRVNWKV